MYNEYSGTQLFVIFALRAALWRFVATGGTLHFLSPHGELLRHLEPQKNVSNCGAK